MHLQRSCFFHWLYRRLNLQYHPFDALKSAILLSLFASALISFSLRRVLLSILVQRVISISPSVGLPPPSFLSQPFFFQRSRFLRGMPYFSEISFASTPCKICMMAIFTCLTAYSFSATVYFLQLPRCLRMRAAFLAAEKRELWLRGWQSLKAELTSYSGCLNLSKKEGEGSGVSQWEWELESSEM